MAARTPFPTRLSIRGQRMRSSIALSMAAGTLCVCLVGCAGWQAWLDPKEAARLAKLYGPTADQRIEELQERSEQAAKAGEQEAFGRELAVAILEEHDPRVRGEIVSLAGHIDSPQARGVCEGGLVDPDPSVRMAACRAWAEKGGDRAVELLAQRIDGEQDIDVRLEAVAALGRTRSSTAIPHLAESLEDSDPAVQYRAVAALRCVSGRDFGNDVNAWRAWAVKEPAAREAEPVTLAERLRKVF